VTDTKKILLIGPYPPPAGGVSIHIERLLRKSIDQSFELAVFDAGKFRFINKSGKRQTIFRAINYFLQAKIVHIHISNAFKIFIGLIVKLFGKKLIYTIHNGIN
jgi:glycosyltransferase involved in cell wall biosynthesis